MVSQSLVLTVVQFLSASLCLMLLATAFNAPQPIEKLWHRRASIWMKIFLFTIPLDSIIWYIYEWVESYKFPPILNIYDVGIPILILEYFWIFLTFIFVNSLHTYVNIMIKKYQNLKLIYIKLTIIIISSVMYIYFINFDYIMPNTFNFIIIILMISVIFYMFFISYHIRFIFSGYIPYMKGI